MKKKKKKPRYSIYGTIEIRCEKGDFFFSFNKFVAYLGDWVGIMSDVRLWLFGVSMINDCKEFIFNRTVTIDLIPYGRWREKKKRESILQMIWKRERETGRMKNSNEHTLFSHTWWSIHALFKTKQFRSTRLCHRFSFIFETEDLVILIENWRMIFLLSLSSCQRCEEEKKDNQRHETISLDLVSRVKKKKRERERIHIFFPASSHWPCSYDIDSTLEDRRWRRSFLPFQSRHRTLDPSNRKFNQFLRRRYM